MLELVSFLFAIGVGFGTSCWIFGTLLNKSNNIGDSKGAKYEYNTNVNITSRSDRLSKETAGAGVQTGQVTEAGSSAQRVPSTSDL